MDSDVHQNYTPERLKTLAEKILSTNTLDTRIAFVTIDSQCYLAQLLMTGFRVAIVQRKIAIAEALFKALIDGGFLTVNPIESDITVHDPEHPLADFYPESFQYKLVKGITEDSQL